MDESDTSASDCRELLGWLEFGCWTALVLYPILYWQQGPAVSQDQFVVRTGLVVVAAVGAVGLRTAALVSRMRARRRPGPERTPPAPVQPPRPA